MNDSESHILWGITYKWWSGYYQIPCEKRLWTVLGSGDGNIKEWKAHRNISEMELLVLNDLLEALGITVFSGIYCVNLAIHLLTITTVIADT